MRTTLTLLLSGTAALALSGGLAAAQELDLLADNSPETIAAMEALTAAYSAANPGVTFNLEFRPGGGDGDNIVKTRLATGEMADIFQYNTGSLFQALNPVQSMLPIGDLPNIANINAGFLPTVTGTNGEIYGVPFGPAMGGGIFYNREIYAELGLSIPMTWDDLIANAEAAKDAGYIGMVQTHGSTWTSQIFVLGDFFNVLAAEPDFAERYTANQAKYATSEAALRGFTYNQQVYELGLLNEDFGAATFEEGMEMVATGAAAHYPMLTFAIGQVATNLPEDLPNLGFFAIPGPTAEPNGLTIWTPSGVYIAANTDQPETARDFVNWLASVEACQIMMEAQGVNGPYLISGCELPEDIPPAVADMLPYFETEGRTAPALEFLSPIKGPNLEHLLVEVGAGIRSAEEAAALYDQDVVKQAQQLGLPGW